MLPGINLPFDLVASVLGASTDELKLIFSFLLSYPLAALLKRIPDNRPDLKNVYIVTVALFYLVGLFDLWSGIRTLFIASAGTYAIARYIRSSLMPWIGFIFCMGHMSANQIIRELADNPSTVDITGAQMVLVMKLTAFCWNVQDGREKQDQISDFQKERAILEMPSLLDFAGYVLFFPSLMVGPAFDYIEYRRWLETTMFDLPPGTDPVKAPKTRKKHKIPRSGTPAMMKMATGLIWLLLFLQLAPRFDPSYMVGSDFTTHGFLRRVWILHMTGFMVRTKFYAVWSLAEGSCILAGIGFKGLNPKTGRVDWNRLQNVNPAGIEFAQNTRAYLAEWNINTNKWLRNYVYLRVTPKGKKPGFRASMATFVTSAFWHGFAPGYYLTFVLASFIQSVAKNCRRYIRPLFLTADGQRPNQYKIYFDIASWLTTQATFSFVVAPFYLLTLQASLLAWARVYFYCIVGVAGAMAFFASPGKAWLRQYAAPQIQKTAKPAAPVVGPAATNSATESGATTPTLAHQTGLDPRRLGDDLSEKLGVDVRPAIGRSESRADIRGGQLGLPEDPMQDLDEILDELKKEVSTRRARGQTIGDGLREAMTTVQENMSELKRSQEAYGFPPASEKKEK